MSMSVCPVFGDVLSSIMDVVFGVKVGAVGGTESGIMVGSIVGTLLGKLDGANNTEGFVNSDVLSEKILKQHQVCPIGFVTKTHIEVMVQKDLITGADGTKRPNPLQHRPVQ